MVQVLIAITLVIAFLVIGMLMVIRKTHPRDVTRHLDRYIGLFTIAASVILIDLILIANHYFRYFK